jgi:hypothetical protein
MVILRPTNKGEHMVVGESSIHGFMDAETFLGSLGSWEVRIGFRDKVQPCFINTKNGAVTTDDPRLGPLPPEWEPIDGPETVVDETHFAWFKNKATEEEMDSDPRMLPEALEKRGVKLETFRLV